MTAYERLNRVRNYRWEYRRLLQKVEELETIATRTVPMLSQTPESHGSLKLNDDTWARLADYREECKAALNRYLNDCRELEKELECIKSTRIRTAMHYRYVDGCKVTDIAAMMNYEQRQIHNFLRMGEKIYCETWEEKHEL